MIDIHTHVLPFVDDGCQTLEESVELVTELYKKGVTDIICTPHLSHKFVATEESILNSMDALRAELKKLNLPVNLYYGRELFLGRTLVKEVKPFSEYSLNGTDFVLVEFSFEEYTEIKEYVYSLVRKDVKPIVAHFERYSYADINTALEVKRLGGHVSINASSLMPFSKYRKQALRLLNNGLIDFIASDAHYGRKTCMDKAYNLVKRKFGKRASEILFKLNAELIINGK